MEREKRESVTPWRHMFLLIKKYWRQTRKGLQSDLCIIPAFFFRRAAIKAIKKTLYFVAMFVTLTIFEYFVTEFSRFRQRRAIFPWFNPKRTGGAIPVTSMIVAAWLHLK